MNGTRRIERLLLLSACLVLLCAFVSCAVAPTPAVEAPTESSTEMPAATEPPTETPAPTDTPEPTETPTPSPTPAPSLQEWLAQLGGQCPYYGSAYPVRMLGEDGEFFYWEETTQLFIKQGGKWIECGALSEEGLQLVRRVFDGAELPPLLAHVGEPLSELLTDPETGGTFSGWYDSEAGTQWDPSEPTPDRPLTLCGYTLSELPHSAPLLTREQIDRTAFRNTGTNGILVIFIGFTDGYAYDEAALRDLFEGDYPYDQCLRSAASYFKYMSGGRADFDVQYYCCETGMTSAEGYALVQTRFNDFLIDIFNKIRKAEPDLTRAADKDGDGVADMVVFLCGEDPAKTVGDGLDYYLYGGALGTTEYQPDQKTPTLHKFIKLAYDAIAQPLEPATMGTGPRTLLHELSHGFGIDDYYDFHDLGGEYISPLGGFDMQENNFAEWNPYSRFTCGWTEPYVITPETGTVTLRIGCAPDCAETVLLPTSLGWNGTPFDEYLLIDVLAPVGANGYDWAYLTEWTVTPEGYEATRNGGVRILHVDARLVEAKDSNYGRIFTRVDTYEDILRVTESRDFLRGTELWIASVNSNGYPPYLEGDSPYWHNIGVIPRDGSDRFRICHPTGNSIYTILTSNDLYQMGDEFSMERDSDAFPEGPLMNNGGTMDYTMRVEIYDPVRHEAIVTIGKIGQ